MSIETRVRRINEAIEDTPEAVDARSWAVHAVTYGIGGKAVGETVANAIIPAANAVLAKHPEIASELHYRDLVRYMTRQVIALVKGEDAVLDLPSEAPLN
jgi:hypothetical protein